jgi:hypothetical protein
VAQITERFGALRFGEENGMNVITSVTTTTTSVDVREYLTAARTYYVRTDGSDSNDGLSNTSGGAFLTIQRAVNVVCAEIDINTQAVTIQVEDGPYNAPVSLRSFIGTGTVTLRGNVTTPTNVTINSGTSNTITALGGRWSVQGFALSASGSADCILGDGPARVTFSAMDFGACGRYHVVGFSGAVLIGTGTYSISGGGFGHLASGTASRLGLNAATVTLTGTPAFTAFAVATMGSGIEFYTTTFTGAATGKRYDANTNGVLNTGGAGANYFPGSMAGTATSGGQYI